MEQTNVVVNVPEGKVIDYVSDTWAQQGDNFIIVYLKNKPKPWYEKDLGKGILCFVWDDWEECKSLRLVTGYVTENDYYKFRTKYSVYKNATPLTPDEIKEFTVCSN